MNDIKKLESISSQVRRDILRMVSAVNSGHPGGSMSSTDLMVALYFEIMKHDPATFTIEGKGEDVFYLSNGHISPVWYSVLARSGYFEVSELSTFRVLGSRLQGHPTTCKKLPGIRMASGSLGQGLSCASGHALAKKSEGDTNNVYVLMGDGETQEGQVWEAAMFAGAAKIDNLIAIVDWNNQQIDGTCDQVVTLGDYQGKWKSFGWEVIEMDGHNFEDILAKMAQAKAALGNSKPVVVLMHSKMGQGVDFMCDTNEFHGKVPSKEQIENALSQLEETLGDY